jgi:hypothetical protein
MNYLTEWSQHFGCHDLLFFFDEKRISETSLMKYLIAIM